MLPAYSALQTDDKNPVLRYANRAYFIIDKTGTVRFAKVMDNPLDLLNPEEVLQAVKAFAS
jgi:peroxiredoxin